MARITVEDCLNKIKNHFELVLIASTRAKDILNGNNPAIPRNNSSVSVVVLREISENAVDIEQLREELLLNESKNGNNLRAPLKNYDVSIEQSEVVLEEDEAKNLLIIDDDSKE